MEYSGLHNKPKAAVHPEQQQQQQQLTLGSSYSLDGASPCAFPIEFT
jgi:hypothetical protein